MNSFDPELQLKDTESAIRNKLIDSSSKAEALIINESDINKVFVLIYITIIPNIQKSFEKGSGCYYWFSLRW